MNFKDLKLKNEFVLLDCISGSKAYNLALPSSDTDRKGIFILPQEKLYGFEFTEQVNNESNDEVYFEVGRFLELLVKNNPNILELLSTPKQWILYKHPLMDLIKPEDFLSKLCLDTFAGYANTQIKKAKGLNKKINQSFESERKAVIHFCYVVHENGSIPLKEWLKKFDYLQENCGLISLPHFRDTYLLFHQSQFTTKEKLYGIVSGSNAEDVQVSFIPKGTEPLAVMNFNKDAYSVYCREYREYWEWVKKRNETRFQSTVSHGKSYDAKHMMHTFRLLTMAEEIAIHHKVIVHRTDRDYLLRIRNGEFEFEELMQGVEEKMDRIKILYEKSDLPDMPDKKKAEDLLIKIREEFYGKVGV